MRRIPAAIRLFSLSISATLALPAVADIDLVGDTTLFNSGDVTLSNGTSLSSFNITEHTLAAPYIKLDGTGSISQSGTLQADFTDIYGSIIQLSTAARLNSQQIYLNTGFWIGNSSINADGVDTQINSNELNLNSWDGYQASLNLSNGAAANINYQLRINGADSVVNIDNASLTTQDLHNEGTINVSGANSSLQITNNGGYSNEPLGHINFSNGAQFAKNDLNLRQGDLITASGAGTQINSYGTFVEGTTLSLHDGAALNSQAHISVMVNNWAGNASITADGENTQINTDHLSLMSQDGYQASLNLSNGAAATINQQLYILGNDSVVNLDNASLTTNNLRNEGTINVSGGNSSLQITNNGGYSNEPLGQINFSNGAQFAKNDLNLRQGDLITAFGAGTQINSYGTFIEGTTLSLNDGAALNSQSHISVMVNNWAGNASITADGENTQINTDHLSLMSQDGYQASLNLSNGAAATINQQLYILGNDSVVNLDNASLTTNNLRNEGTINVSGGNSSLQITNNGGYSNEPLGQINFSNGAHFAKNDLNLRQGDLITASGAGTQINSYGTFVEGTTLSLNDGAALNSQSHISVMVNNWADNASIIADGENTQINTDHLSLISQDGYQASLNLSNGAAGTINQQLYILGNDSVVNLDNASLTTNNLRNEGTINVSGGNSSLQITNNGGYSNEPLGHINFSNGAQFAKNDLNLRQGDLITASGAGTQINSYGTFVEGTTLSLHDGAALNSQSHISVMVNNWAENASITADGENTQINTDHLSLMSQDGYQASLNLSNGAAATINHQLYILGNDSVVNLDNASLNTRQLHNEGTINVSGAASSLQITDNYYSGEPLGKINFSNGAQFNKDDLQLRNGDLITATGAGTQINSVGLFIADTVISLSDEATLNSQGHIFISANSSIIVDDASINTSSLQNYGSLISKGHDQLTGHINNNGIIEIADQLTITGDLNMQGGSELLFDFGDDPLNEFGTLMLNGYLWGENPINIRFDATEYMEADHAYGYTIDLIVASSFLPGLEMFNVDMSAFNFLGNQWNRSVSVIDNRLVLSVTSEVPVPASIWLMMSALVTLGAMKKRKNLIH